jgi:hypothetical protein
MSVDKKTGMSASHFGLQDARQMKALAKIGALNHQI